MIPKCPKCDAETIKYGELLLHPPNQCDVGDGCSIIVENEDEQDAFLIITKPQIIVEKEAAVNEIDRLSGTIKFIKEAIKKLLMRIKGDSK